MANNGWGSGIFPSKLESIPSRRVKISFTLNGEEYASEQDFSIVAPGTIHFNLGTARVSTTTSSNRGCSGSCGGGCSGCSGPGPGG